MYLPISSGNYLCVVSSFVAGHQVKIRPSAAQFTKPLGSSIVFTCEAVGLDATAARTVRLQWMGMDGKEISDSSGRYWCSLIFICSEHDTQIY